MGGTLLPLTCWYGCLEGLALGSLTLGQRLIKSNNLPGWTNIEWGCWYPASSFNRPLHTFLTQYQRISAQDQFKIRLFEPLRIVKRSLSSFCFLRSDQSCRFCYRLQGPGPKGTPWVSIYFCPAGEALRVCKSVCAVGEKKVRKRNSIYSMRVTTIPRPVGKETQVALSDNTVYLSESDVSEMTVVKTASCFNYLQVITSREIADFYQNLTTPIEYWS